MCVLPEDALLQLAREYIRKFDGFTLSDIRRYLCRNESDKDRFISDVQNLTFKHNAMCLWSNMTLEEKKAAWNELCLVMVKPSMNLFDLSNPHLWSAEIPRHVWPQIYNNFKYVVDSKWLFIPKDYQEKIRAFSMPMRQDLTEWATQRFRLDDLPRSVYNLKFHYQADLDHFCERVDILDLCHRISSMPISKLESSVADVCQVFPMCVDTEGKWNHGWYMDLDLDGLRRLWKILNDDNFLDEVERLEKAEKAKFTLEQRVGKILSMYVQSDDLYCQLAAAVLDCPCDTVPFTKALVKNMESGAIVNLEIAETILQTKSLGKWAKDMPLVDLLLKRPLSENEAVALSRILYWPADSTNFYQYSTYAEWSYKAWLKANQSRKQVAIAFLEGLLKKK